MAAVVRYGSSVADESDLRLCGDVAGKRVIELGISAPSNAVALASAGALAIAVDPSADRISLLRRQAEQAEVTIKCHHSDIADLGFAMSGSIDLVLAVHTLTEIDDLSRLLRQVHRVLRPDAAFILAEQHPIAAMLTTTTQAGAQTGAQAATLGQSIERPYGASTRSISEVFMAMQRSNFRIDTMLELMPLNNRNAVAPLVLLIRARKLGV
jgi:SAM-dependent methyltransferase